MITSHIKCNEIFFTVFTYCEPFIQSTSHSAGGLLRWRLKWSIEYAAIRTCGTFNIYTFRTPHCAVQCRGFTVQVSWICRMKLGRETTNKSKLDVSLCCYFAWLKNDCFGRRGTRLEISTCVNRTAA